MNVNDDYHEPIHTLDQALHSKDRGSPAPSPASRVQSVRTALNQCNNSSPHICNYFGRSVLHEVSREYLRTSIQATQKAVEIVRSVLFITGTAEVKGGLKKAS